ncbi:MAG: MBL fold metallo-hydrolase [Christensenellaceae bacterium]|jgi:glyoxylase-like metal-dependent hydrolase (beta-lactamase superfamily II)|nr:MBL fold metallo-hydrolase [Christensenellaceae bacterium]
MREQTVVTTLHTGPLGTNTYIVRGAKAGACFIIDPADYEKKVGPYLQANGLTCEAVLLTHCHFDHIMGVAALQRQGAKVYIGEPDAQGLRDEAHNLGNGRIYAIEHCEPDVLLHDGDTIDAAGFHLRVIATPGHTKGGVCYLLESDGTLFSGDTLFYQEVGRCDLRGGDAWEMHRSLGRLTALPGDYAVLPGHSRPTTLQHEREANIYIQKDPSQW